MQIIFPFFCNFILSENIAFSKEEAIEDRWYNTERYKNVQFNCFDFWYQHFCSVFLFKLILWNVIKTNFSVLFLLRISKQAGYHKCSSNSYGIWRKLLNFKGDVYKLCHMGEGRIWKSLTELNLERKKLYKRVDKVGEGAKITLKCGRNFLMSPKNPIELFKSFSQNVASFSLKNEFLSNYPIKIDMLSPMKRLLRFWKGSFMNYVQ